MREAADLELARRHFLPFVRITFPEFQYFPVNGLLADELERFEQAVEAKERPRLIINMPVRVGKSEMVSRRFPPWVLGRHPDWYIGLISYGDDFAEELSADARRVVMDDDYAKIFGLTYQQDKGSSVQIDQASKSVRHWRIKDHRGGLRAAGINGALTGRGYNIMILDDPTKGRKEADSAAYREEQWTQYVGTFLPRLEPGGGVIIMATRWTTDDIPGRLISEMQEDPEAEQWRVISIPAQAEPTGVDLLGRKPGEWLQCRFDEQEWERIKKLSMSRSPRDWFSQYQQRPIPADGQIFKPYEQFVFEPPPQDEDGGEWRGARYGFADTSHAKKRESDFSVIGVWQLEPNHTIGLLDVFRNRVQFPELKRVAKTMYDHYKLFTMVIEDYSSGVALSQEFMREARMRISTWRPDRDKVARAHAATDVMATWRIRLPRGDYFPSGLPVKTYLDELASFRGNDDEHDDMVDMTTMALYLMGTRNVPAAHQLRSVGFEMGA